MSDAKLLFALLIVTGCSLSSCERESIPQAQRRQDSIAPYQVTMLSELPDSLKPVPRYVSEFDPPTVTPLTINNTEIANDSGPGRHPNTRTAGLDFTNYTTANSISHNRITTVLSDHSGNLWFGTDGGGIIRFDGYAFTHFGTQHGLSDINIGSIAEDDRGTLWFGTLSGGLISYDGISFQNYTVEDGLAANHVKNIVLDKHGIPWTQHTTTDHISTFRNGHPIALHKDSGGIRTNVQTIHADSKGNIWLGMWGAASRLDGQSFSYFLTDHDKGCNHIQKVVDDHAGNLWFAAAHGGLYRLNADHLDHPCFLNTCSHHLNRQEDSVEHSREISRGFTTFSTMNGLPDDHIYGFEIDTLGNIWMLTGGDRIIRYNQKVANIECELGQCQHDLANPSEADAHNHKISKGFSTFTTESGLPRNIKFLKADSRGNLWVATRNGVARYEPRYANRQCELGECRHDLRTPTGTAEHNSAIAHGFTIITRSEGLIGDNVTAIVEDRSSHIWIGTLDNGICRFNGTSFTSYSTEQGLLSNWVTAVSEDATGTIWFGSRQGPMYYDGRSFHHYSQKEGLQAASISYIFQDRAGQLWFAHPYSFTVFDGSSFSHYTSHGVKVYGSITSIVQDKTGNIWFGALSRGVCRFDGRSYMQLEVQQGLAGRDVGSMLVDKDDVLWIGTYDGGVSRYDGRSIINFRVAHGLASNIVSAISEDEAGNLWICTVKGISVLRSDVKDSLLGLSQPTSEAIQQLGPLFENIGTSQGLPDPNVSSVAFDSTGRIYAGTSKGLCELVQHGSSWKVSTSYNRALGFPIGEVGNVHVDKHGIVWLSNNLAAEGIYRFDPRLVERDDAPVSLRIDAISLGEGGTSWYDIKPRLIQHREDHRQILDQQEVLSYGKTLTPAERDSLKSKYAGVEFDSILPFFSIPVNLRLPYDHDQIRIRFLCVETGVNSSIRYQYMLEDHDETWSDPTVERVAVYRNLPSGSYTFKVRARRGEGAWSTPTVYSFQVIPAWWATWWAYTLFIASGMGAVIGTIKWRERKLLQEKNKLERIVELRTAEVVAEKNEVQIQRQRSEALLLNILPEEVAEELKATGSSEARQYDEVTVLFTDFKDFTGVAEKMTPVELVEELNVHFRKFDEITSKYQIEKIKTIGDSYLCVGGLPRPSARHAVDVVKAGLEMQQFVQQHALERRKKAKDQLLIRIGIHSGPVVAGIVGIKKYAYDIWGDTVNTASRMESSSEPGKVNISESTYELIKDTSEFSFEERGLIEAKGKGKLRMYFVSRRV